MARLCFKEDKHRYAKAQRANKSHSSFGKYVVFFEGIEDVCGCFFSFESKSMTGLNTTAGTLKL